MPLRECGCNAVCSAMRDIAHGVRPKMLWNDEIRTRSARLLDVAGSMRRDASSDCLSLEARISHAVPATMVLRRGVSAIR